MCFIDLEDFTHSLEIVVFPRVFYQNVNLLVPDSAVMVQGRVNLTDDGAKLLADTFCPLAEYRPEYYITLQAEQEKEDVFQALKKIFTEYHGEHVVYLHMAGRWQKTGPQFWLNAAPGAAEAIEELLGKGAVRQR